MGSAAAAAGWASAAGAVLGAVTGRNSANKAAKSERLAQDKALAATKRATDLARSQAMPLFDAAQQSRQQGFQGALDMFGQTIPAQIDAYQGGNMNAQNTLLAGLDPQMQAILGGQVDLSGLQAQQSQAPPASMFQQQLPPQQSIQDILNPPASPFLEGDAYAGLTPRQRAILEQQRSGNQPPPVVDGNTTYYSPQGHGPAQPSQQAQMGGNMNFNFDPASIANKLAGYNNG